MVYYSGSRNASHAASICNRTNVCGGPKKAGIAPSVGYFFMASSRGQLLRAPQSIPLVCVPNYTTQTQKYGYRATIGGNMG
jgi:hypothetical protein